MKHLNKSKTTYKNKLEYLVEVEKVEDRIFLNGKMDFNKTDAKEIIPVLSFALIGLLEDKDKFEIPQKDSVFYYQLIEKLHKVATKQFF